MINVFFNGRLGADVEICRSKDGKEFLSFSVAVNEKRGGEKKTIWMRVRSSQMNLAPYLKKGSYVSVMGNELINTYLNKSGEMQFSREVNAFNINFVDVSNKENTTDNQQENKRLEGNNIQDMSCGVLQPQVSLSQTAVSDNDDLPF